MPKRIGKWFLRNACVWMLALVLIVPLLHIVGLLTGRELVLYAPQNEFPIRAALLTVLSVIACIGRKDAGRASRVCSMMLPTMTVVCEVFPCIGATYFDWEIRLTQSADVFFVMLECAAAVVAYIACSGQKIGRALLGLGMGVLLPLGILLSMLSGWGWLVLGAAVVGCVVYAGAKSLVGMLSGFLCALMMTLCLFVSLSMTDYRVDVSAEVSSPDGMKAARLVHPKNLMDCSQRLKIYEDGRGIWVGIGHLRKVETINLKNEYAHVYDEEAQEFLPLSWQDNDTILLDGDAVRRDGELPFERYIDVLIIDDSVSCINQYCALGAKKTGTGELQFRYYASMPFEADEMEVYEVNRSHCTKLTEEQDLLWQSEHWVSAITQVEKDGELSAPDETMKRMFELVHEQAEHWIMNLKVYKVGDEYFIRTMLNVNLWTPYELFRYDAKQDELVLLHTFDGMEIAGIHLHEGFLNR